jgi:hypothetical protein
MRTSLFLGSLAWMATACGGNVASLPPNDSPSPDATVQDGAPVADGGPGREDATLPDSGVTEDSSSEGTCESLPWRFGGGDAEPAWATRCPDAGCPEGTVCVRAAIADGVFPIGCAPVPASCGGNPSCACMGCVCGGGAPPLGGCAADPGSPGYPVVCQTGTLSRRAFKDDVTYVDDEEREALARQALAIPLARYRYKTEAPGVRRRLGFIIDDQPDPSPAVDGDRTHVDQYGYTSMLLATVQEQAKELEALRRRIEVLEEHEARAPAARPR